MKKLGTFTRNYRFQKEINKGHESVRRRGYSFISPSFEAERAIDIQREAARLAGYLNWEERDVYSEFIKEACKIGAGMFLGALAGAAGGYSLSKDNPILHTMITGPIIGSIVGGWFTFVSSIAQEMLYHESYKRLNNLSDQRRTERVSRLEQLPETA